MKLIRKIIHRHPIYDILDDLEDSLAYQKRRKHEIEKEIKKLEIQIDALKKTIAGEEPEK